MVIRYHVFTDTKDDFFGEDELEEAICQMQRHLDSGQTCIRLYKELYANQQDYEDDNMEKEMNLFWLERV